MSESGPSVSSPVPCGASNTPQQAQFPPTFVACGARSGSTLLRWLIDAHPAVSCPGETDIAVLLNCYVGTASALATGMPERLAPLQRARAVADQLMGTHLSDVGKARWCDKSLSNVFHLDQLRSAWPDAHFILLHRHCMDFVMNGLEVSPWGLSDFGFAQVAQMSPTDSVVALVAYWVDRTTRLLAFEERFPERCLRIRYEDLATQTEDVMKDVWHFIGVEPVEGVATDAFAVDHSSHGPADHEIWYTSGVHHESIGRGARIPPDHVTGPLRASVNDLLQRLDYSVVSDAWGSGATAPGDLAVSRACNARSGDAAYADLRVLEGHEVLWRQVIDLASPEWVRDEGDDAGRVEDPSRGSSFVVAVERDTLRELYHGRGNVGTALQSRTLRYYGPLPIHFNDERAVFERVHAFFATVRQELLPLTGA